LINPADPSRGTDEVTYNDRHHREVAAVEFAETVDDALGELIGRYPTYGRMHPGG